jgi:serine/threonine protein kinase
MEPYTRSQKFKQSYTVTDRLLGSGAFGKVFMAVEQKSRVQLACKIVNLRPLQRRMQFGKSEGPLPAEDIDLKSQVRRVKLWSARQKPENQFDPKLRTYYREFEILSSIRHPNIIGLEKVFVTDNTM